METIKIKEVRMTDIPWCDYCTDHALYDSPTRLGYWAHMCAKDMRTHGRMVNGLTTRLIQG